MGIRKILADVEGEINRVIDGKSYIFHYKVIPNYVTGKLENPTN